MSDFKWIMCSLNDGEYAIANNIFSEAFKNGIKPRSGKQSIELYQETPESILAKYISRENLPEDMDKDVFVNGFIDNQHVIEFASAFWVDALADLALKFPYSEKNVLSFEAYEIQPYSVLAYALGIDVCDELPGVYGNMLIRNADLPEMIKTTEKVLATIDERSLELSRRYINMCSTGKIDLNFEKEIQGLFNNLPEKMQQAYEAKSHFFAITFWMG